MAVELDTNNNGAIDIEKGGTNATTALQARINLGAEEAGTTAAHNSSPTAHTGVFVVDADPRLTDSRTPTAHKTTHATGGTDVLSKSDIGLGNVDNTSDANKPVSTATQTALNLKSDASHGHTTLTVQLIDYSEKRNNLGTLGSTATIALTNGNYHEGVVGSSNVTITLPAAPSTGVVKSFTAALKQHASTARTVTFSGGAGVKWLSSTIAATTTVGKWTVWVFFYSETEGKWLSTGAIQEP